MAPEPRSFPSEAAPAPLVEAVIRRHRSAGATLSRRALLRRSLGAAVGLWLVETAGGTIGFLWSAVTLAGLRVRVGTLGDLVAANAGLPIADGFPAYVPAARSFVVLVDPTVQRFVPGVDATGEGVALNVRALSQRCPHLGCRPNPCVEDRWFHCPCHQSRYDRLGTKAAGTAFGPAARSMDRFGIEVDRDGVLTIDTSQVVLGPLPVALGQPGIEPPKAANACA